jgi:hypothetical protein
MDKLEYIILGVSGKIGSGKNYITENVFLPELYKIAQDNHTQIMPYYFSFGDHLKVECLCRVPYDELNQTDGYYGFFVEKTQATRDKLQKYGTENGRNVYHQDVWVRAIDTWINIQMERLNNLKKHLNNANKILPVFVISDIRFMNEAEYVRSKNGILIRINAPNRTLHRVRSEAKGDTQTMDKIMSHASEISLDDYDFDNQINNDLVSIDEIKEKCQSIINKILV